MFGLTGVWRYVVPGLAALALIVALVVGVRGCAQDERDENNQLINSGVVQEREAAKTEVINRVEKARDAVDAPSDAERRNVCSKYDRNCQDGQ